jgi:hypothetical protein
MSQTAPALFVGGRWDGRIHVMSVNGAGRLPDAWVVPRMPDIGHAVFDSSYRCDKPDCWECYGGSGLAPDYIYNLVRVYPLDTNGPPKQQLHPIYVLSGILSLCLRDPGLINDAARRAAERDYGLLEEWLNVPFWRPQ